MNSSNWDNAKIPFYKVSAWLAIRYIGQWITMTTIQVSKRKSGYDNGLGVIQRQRYTFVKELTSAVCVAMNHNQS